MTITATDAISRPTLEEISRWPAAVSIPQACAALGISRSHGYELAERGEFPAQILPMGGRRVVITRSLYEVLGGEVGQGAH